MRPRRFRVPPLPAVGVQRIETRIALNQRAHLLLRESESVFDLRKQ